MSKVRSKYINIKLCLDGLCSTLARIIVNFFVWYLKLWNLHFKRSNLTWNIKVVRFVSRGYLCWNALKCFMISFNNFMSPLTKPIDWLLPYPLSLMLYLKIRPILDWMASHGAPWCCDFEQVPYKTIKKFDVSWDDPGVGSYYAAML